MATIHFDAAGDNSDGLTWAKAYTTLTNYSTNVTQGDTVLLDSTFAASHTAALTLAPTGSADSDLITTHYSCTHSGDTTTAYSAGAKVLLTGNYDLTLGAQNKVMYWRGVDFEIGDEILAMGDSHFIFEDCNFWLAGGASSDEWNMGSNQRLDFINCTFRWASGQGFTVSRTHLTFKGCKDHASSADIGTVGMINGFVNLNVIEMEDCDFSIHTALIGEGTADLSGGTGQVRLNRCKLPTNIFQSALGNPNIRAEAYGCDTGTDSFGIHVQDNFGTANDDSGIYRTATYDGTNGYSVKMVSTAETYPGGMGLRVHIGDVWVTSATATLTVELVEDNATPLQDDEFFVEIEQTDSTGPAGEFWSSKVSAAGQANLTSSAESWTGTGGFANEDKRKISVTLGTDTAAAKIGLVSVWAVLAPGSVRTVYVDPHIDET